MGLVHLAVILGSATLALGQSFPGDCSKISTVKDLDKDKVSFYIIHCLLLISKYLVEK